MTSQSNPHTTHVSPDEAPTILTRPSQDVPTNNVEKEEEDRLIIPLIIPPEVSATGNVPSVAGTPQVGTVPSIPGGTGSGTGSAATTLTAGTMAKALVVLAICAAVIFAAVKVVPPILAHPTSTPTASVPGKATTTFVIPTTASSSPTPTSTQPTQATPSPATSLRGVDWTKVITSTELGCNGPSAPNLGTLVDVKQFADVTGDNNPEAFVAAACVGSTESWPDRLEVFDGASDPAHPRRIATLLDYQDGTDGTNGYGLRIQSITISGKMVTIVSRGWTPGECFACGDQRVTDTFTWNGSSFTRGSRSVTLIT